MFNIRTLAIIKRELREKLFSKSFILMTLLIPVFMFGVLGIQMLLMTMSDDEGTRIEIISETDIISKKIENDLSTLEFVKNGLYRLQFRTIEKKNFDGYLKENKKTILEDQLTGIIFIPQSALKDKSIFYYSKNPNNNSMFNKLRNPINQSLVSLYFEHINVSSEDISFASKGVEFNGFRVSEEEKIEEEGYGNMVASFLFTFLLYFSLIFIGTLMMRSVVQEKSNRIVEVLLSSVNAKELMTGKILGTSIMGVAQMAIWLLPIMVLISTTWFMLPPEFILKLNLGHILYFLLNYLIGLITFLGLFASVGAIFDNDQDAQSGMWPIMILIMIPFYIAITMTNNPDTSLIKISSIVPFSSIIVMPARMTVIDVPAIELVLSIIINLATMVGVFMFAGKIYRVGILMTGKKPKWSEVVRWFSYKY